MEEIQRDFKIITHDEGYNVFDNGDISVILWAEIDGVDLGGAIIQPDCGNPWHAEFTNFVDAYLTEEEQEAVLKLATAEMKKHELEEKNEFYREQIENRDDFEDVILPKAEKISTILGKTENEVYPLAVQTKIDSHTDFQIWLSINFELSSEESLRVIRIIESVE